MGIKSSPKWEAYSTREKVKHVFFPVCSARRDHCITISAFRRYEAIWHSCILSRCKLNDVKANPRARGLDHTWALAAAEVLCDDLPVYSHALEPLNVGKSGATP